VRWQSLRAYRHGVATQEGFLRRLDHAAIFLAIAGTYTRFTTCRLHGVWHDY
jgi:channel protein (hemolysin III family)